MKGRAPCSLSLSLFRLVRVRRHLGCSALRLLRPRLGRRCRVLCAPWRPSLPPFLDSSSSSCLECGRPCAASVVPWHFLLPALLFLAAWFSVWA